MPLTDDIKQSIQQGYRDVLAGKDIRARYTILHLAHELGVLSDFVDETVPTHFG